MKKTIFIFLLCLFGFINVAEAKTVTFKVVNEFGVPQPIEVRQDFRTKWGTLGEVKSGFGQVNFNVYLDGGSANVLVTRKYSNNSKESSPEGLGISYKITSSSPSLIETKVSSIKTRYNPRPVRNADRAIIGLINDIREENGLSRIHRIEALDKSASLWAQQIEGANGDFVQNYNLMWNFGANGYISYVNYSWNTSKRLIIDQFFNQKCPSYLGNGQVPCKDIYLDPLLKHIAVASVGDVTWIFSLNNCQGDNCINLDDSGDSTLLENPFCEGNCQCNNCSLKQKPIFKVKKIIKKKRFIKVLVKSNASGKTQMNLRQKSKTFIVRGKKTNFGFIYKVKRSFKFNPKKGFKSRIFFYGNDRWYPASIKFRIK